MSRRSLLAVAAASATLVAAGCGSDDQPTTVTATGSGSGGMSGMSGHGGDAAAETMRMQKAGSVTKGDLSIELVTMAPVTFKVSQGTRLITHAPRPDDTAHLMVVLADAKTKDRLPDAAVTARITDARGRVVYTGPQYPMTGRGTGLHYGDNAPLPRAGKYVAELVVGPPAIGRHADTATRWRSTVRVAIPFTWSPPAR